MKFENDHIELFSRFLAENMVVFDVGANIGFYSLLASKRVGNTGMVYAFEPSEWAWSRLLKNASDFGGNNIELVNTAVGSFDGETVINITEDDAYNSIGDRPMKAVLSKKIIPIVSLDKYAKMNHIKKVDIIKCDTEGAEYLVFLGAKEILQNHSPVLFFEYNPFAGKGFTFAPDEALHFLKTCGYEFFELIENKIVKIKNFRPIGYDLIGIKKDQEHSALLKLNQVRHKLCTHRRVK